jgi:hypothetical protein
VKQVATLDSTIIIGVVVPSAQHASKIGRGGSALQDLQRKTGATIHFPGSRQYGSFGEISNSEEMEGVEVSDIVKVAGSKEAVQAAKELLSVSSERPQAERRERGGGAGDWPTRTISIPTKYYHAIADQQNLIRNIRGVGGQVTIPKPAPARPTVQRPTGNGAGAAKSARIDVEDGEEEVEGEWVLSENYEGAEEGSLDWVVKAKEDDLERAVKVLEDFLNKAKSATHGEYRFAFMVSLWVNVWHMLIGLSWSAYWTAPLGIP